MAAREQRQVASDAGLSTHRVVVQAVRLADREGVDGPAGVSIVGDEATVRAGIQRFADAGTTDFTPVELVTNDDETQRTRALLKDLIPG